MRRIFLSSCRWLLQPPAIGSLRNVPTAAPVRLWTRTTLNRPFSTTSSPASPLVLDLNSSGHEFARLGMWSDAQRAFTQALQAMCSDFSPRTTEAESIVAGVSIDRLADESSCTNTALLLSNLAATKRQACKDPQHVQVQEAIALLKCALHIYDRHVEGLSESTEADAVSLASINTRSHLASILRWTGKLNDAISLYQEILAVQEKTLPPFSKRIGDTLNNLGISYHDRLKRSMRYIEELTEASESGIASDNRRLGHGDEHYFDEEEDFSRAESCFLQAVAVYSTELQVEEWIGNHRDPELASHIINEHMAGSDELIKGLQNISNFYLFHSKHQDAVMYTNHLIELLEEDIDLQTSPSLVNALEIHARCLKELKQPEEARSAVMRAISLCQDADQIDELQLLLEAVSE